MNDRAKPFKIALIAALVAVITLLHYVVISKDLELHMFYRELYFIPIILASFWFALKFGVATSLVVSLIYAPHVFIYNDAHGTFVAVSTHILVFNLVAIVLGWLVDRRARQEQEKIGISQMLAHLSPFVPQSVRRIVEENPEMLKQEKESKEVTVLFLDLEGYTKLSASRSETEVNEMVEEMFSSSVDPIHRSGGDINETAGDGLMIIFKNDDAKTNAYHAVKAALDIHERNREINKRFRENFEPLSVNIGINSGVALVGMTTFKGSLDTRMTYTASGPVTNLAARLADYAKGGDILIGEETRKMIDGRWPVFDQGLVYLKGIDEALRVYSLLKESSLAGSEPDRSMHQVI